MFNQVWLSAKPAKGVVKPRSKTQVPNPDSKDISSDDDESVHLHLGTKSNGKNWFQ